MHSRLYVGQVRHTRYRPRGHSFRYRLFQFYLDLDELPQVLDALPLCSSSRPALVRFDRRDHLGEPQKPLKDAVQAKVVELGGEPVDGPVRLLTNLRYFGYGFNPVSFFFCFDKQEQLRYILAEVNNTPWGERHCYLIPGASGSGGHHSHPKAFHVSPFMGLDMDYHWRVSEPSERLRIHIENRQGDERLFDAALMLERRPLDRTQLLSVLASFPFMTAKTIGAIYFEALRLWLKRVPYHPHTKRSQVPLTTSNDQ